LTTGWRAATSTSRTINDVDPGSRTTRVDDPGGG
jgi:hypothetical protein